MTSRALSPVRVVVPGIEWPPETFLARLFRGLAARGIQMTLIAATAPDASWRGVPNLEILVAPRWNGSYAGRLVRGGRQLAAAALRSWPETRRTYRMVRDESSDPGLYERVNRLLPFVGRQWDVIYFPWNASAIHYFPLMDKAPAVISCRGAQINVKPHDPQKAWLRDGLGSTFGKAAAVHCVSEAIRDEAMRYGLDKSKSVIIRPAIDPDLFRPAAGPRAADGLFRVMSTGSVIWRKGYEYALAAVRRLVDDGLPIHYDIIGGGEETQRLLYTIHDMELTGYVTCHGRLSPADVLARLQQADAFLLTSLSEGISNAVLEAMACGLPVVTTGVGGMAEAVTDGVEGFVVPARDATATAEALRELWRQPALCRRMGAAARLRVSRDFRLSDQADAFADLFRSVA